MRRSLGFPATTKAGQTEQHLQVRREDNVSLMFKSEDKTEVFSDTQTLTKSVPWSPLEQYSTKRGHEGSRKRKRETTRRPQASSKDEEEREG